MLKVHHRLLCGLEFDDTNWFLALDTISAGIMEVTVAGALLFLLIGFIFTSGLIDQELRLFKFLKHRFLWIYPLFSVLRLLGIFFRQIGCFLSGPLRTPIASIVQSTT
ncbi:MAG: hypothetical protein VX867_09435 [Pseudomonadota bacterium]|nr:hypothetical protein [Pseudomonadota bacterium]